MCYNVLLTGYMSCNISCFMHAQLPPASTWRGMQTRWRTYTQLRRLAPYRIYQNRYWMTFAVVLGLSLVRMNTLIISTLSIILEYGENDVIIRIFSILLTNYYYYYYYYYSCQYIQFTLVANRTPTLVSPAHCKRTAYNISHWTSNTFFFFFYLPP